MTTVYTMEEVSRHKSSGDAWVVIDGEVFDVSRFARFHPGGRVVLQNATGGDATELFKRYHDASVLRKYRTKLKIGVIEGSENKDPAPPGRAFLPER